MRDTKVLESFKKQAEKKLKEMNIFKHLKKEVNHGANGTQQEHIDIAHAVATVISQIFPISLKNESI